jgi:hypothetical protein
MMSARKELIVFMLVAAAALGSILSFALTSQRREAQIRPGTLVQADAVGGVCPMEVKVQRGAAAPIERCAARCTPAADAARPERAGEPAATQSCSCEILADRCRAAQ